MAKWRQAIGLVCLAALPGAISQAYAFGLGHATVKSALGQPLRADIDITQITPDEASSLKVAVAPASAFQSRKLNYSSILPEVTITLEHRPDGRSYLRLSSSRPVQEPFVDVLLRAYWGNGELTRDYTLLFDPPNFQEPQAATQIAPQAGQQMAPPATAMQPPMAQRAPTNPVGNGSSTPAKPVATQRQPVAAPAPTSTAQAQTYTVRKGDTLSSIAQQVGVETVSLDQMLTALYRANSGAFIDGNMNLLRAGAILRIPSVQEAQDIPQAKAREVVIAQSQNFQAYRRRLAQMTGQAAPQEKTNPRQAAGKIQAQVQEPVSKASEPKSQLKLSEAAVGTAAQAQTEQASKIAAQKEAQAAATKLAEAKANVAALSKLAASASAAVKAATPAAMPASAAKPAAQVRVQSPVATAASKPKPVVKPVAAPKPPGEASNQPGWLSGLLANPYFAPAAGLIALLLAAWAFLRRRKKGGSPRDSSVFDSRLSAADSFFGGTGGERVDTRNSTLGSSVAYSPSQLDTGDVDPVAEADVYLAYGRDLQAEEILKESLKNHPDRNAARLKLLEIYAKRKDVRSFEMTAAELFALTEGVGDDWKKAQDLGRNLDPINPLYHNTVPPSTINAPTTMPVSDFAPTGSSMLSAPRSLPATELLTSLPSLMTSASTATSAPAGSGLDLDLNLSGPPVTPAMPNKSVTAMAPQRSTPVSAAPAEPAPADKSDSVLNFDFSGFHAPDSNLPVIQPEISHPSDKQPLEFDLGALSLDLPPSEPSTAPVAPAAPVAPGTAQRQEPHAPAQPQAEPMPDSSHGLDTRLALVEECRAMGDVDMARNLLGEIIAESDGETKVRAQRMLAEIG
ncbi:MAG: FimV/HubP family polar landmark protein [Thiomonas sp.]